MSRRLEDPLLAAGPIAVAAAYALHPLAGAAGLAVLGAIALRGVLPSRRRRHGRSGAPVVVVADLTPRRSQPRAQVTAATVAGVGMRVAAAVGGRRRARPAVGGGGVRRTYTPRRRDNAALRAACLQVATRTNARLT